MYIRLPEHLRPESNWTRAERNALAAARLMGVGDDVEMCGVLSPRDPVASLRCTRPKGHDGLHAAGSGSSSVAALWNEQRDTDGLHMTATELDRLASWRPASIEVYRELAEARAGALPPEAAGEPDGMKDAFDALCRALGYEPETVAVLRAERGSITVETVTAHHFPAAS